MKKYLAIVFFRSYPVHRMYIHEATLFIRSRERINKIPKRQKRKDD